jgi:hypothetical protein
MLLGNEYIRQKGFYSKTVLGNLKMMVTSNCILKPKIDGIK